VPVVRPLAIPALITLALLGSAEAETAAIGREPCPRSDVVAFLTSPRMPVSGGRLRVMAATDEPMDATLVILGPDGERIGVASGRRGGPPYWWYAEASLDRPSAYRVVLETGTGVVACQDVRVGGDSSRSFGGAGVTWAVTRDWSRATESLFSAWVEKLFDDPLDREPSWRALHEVTRDPERNVLYEHLGLGEDDGDGLRLEPDCADLPYFLRAYFAWKLGLPFGFSECSRGDGGTPPRCDRWHSNLEPAPAGGTELSRMQDFFSRRLAWVVQSGAGRAPATSDRTDLYPTRIAPDTLRPGTVYADPYGHTLVVVRRVPQTPTSGGLLLAVDAQPDGTVARKRYWRGTFLFAVDPSLGSAGFKHFRPIVRDGAAVRPLDNRQIAASADYGDYSLEQYDAGVVGFYDRMDDVLSPSPRAPVPAFRETIDALDEQIHARIRSVANGEEWVASHPGTIAMPDGAAIFETTGAWEDFATPARDLRLLIAIDVVRGFPDEVTRRPGRFTLPADRSPAAIDAELAELLRFESESRSFTYTRSDGSPWTLTLADVLARAGALEVAYDPNDCVEVRWGAPASSEEASTCTRRAPADQRARMERYREWFRDRRRPAR
jgi:hypothetical protein